VTENAITENEAAVLRAIACNCFNNLNYSTPKTYDECNGDIWADLINDSAYPSDIEGKTLSGVCGSLARKGFIKTSGKGKDCGITMTENGFNEMMKFYNGNLDQ
jgi:hypothetical protein